MLTPFSYKVIGASPVSLDEAKKWFVDILDEDNDIVNDVIQAATKLYEDETRIITRKSIGMISMAKWHDCVHVEHRPIYGVDKIEYFVPGEEVPSSLGTDQYAITVDGLITTIHLVGVQDIQLKEIVSPVKITLDVGYDIGADQDDRKTPHDARVLIKGIGALFYEYRNGPPEKMLDAALKYLSRYRGPAIA